MNFSLVSDSNTIETALITVDSDLSSVLLLLDLSAFAAVDTVDHDTLLQRLEKRIGLKGLALSWFLFIYK